MAQEFKGTILLANGVPAANVEVRLFDKEPPGMVDDDLTITEGVSDEHGHFHLTCRPSRFVDFETLATNQPEQIIFDWTQTVRQLERPLLLDNRLPFVQFRYNLGGEVRTHTAWVHPFQQNFRLPEMPPLEFRPSRHGFAFANQFSGYSLPFSVPVLPKTVDVPAEFGLGGGMVLAALDFLAADRPLPDETDTPLSAALYHYLYQRQIDSFGPFGEQIVRIAQWMALPSDTLYGSQRFSYIEYEKMKRPLAAANPVPLMLICYSGTDTSKVWQNRQVLAWGYTNYFGGQLDIHLYDPTHPGRDDILLRCDEIPVGEGDTSARIHTGFSVAQMVGDEEIPIHGFFTLPYVPVAPPTDL